VMHISKFSFLALTLLLGAAQAEAAPLVDVRAFVSIGLDDLYPTPSGISFGCYGDATLTSACELHASLNATVTASTTLTSTAVGGVVITNTTDHVINDWLSLRTNESAFNAGGPAIGLRIDDPATQGGRYASFIRGMGVGDRHNCSVGTFGYEGAVFSPTTCGVNSPDSSSGAFSFDLSGLNPHEQIFLPYEVSIMADFVLSPPAPVPAPGSLWLLLAGAACLFAVNRALTSPHGSSPGHRRRSDLPA